MTVPDARRGLVAAGFVLLALAPAGTARAQDTGWTIERFRADYVVHADRTIGVTERIDVDFDGLEKHGIYRDVPVSYKRVVSPNAPIPAGHVTYDLRVESVTDAAGQPLQVEVSRQGNERRIRIGDPDRTVTGRQTYVLTYALDGGLGFFDDFDELYWQVTGTRWPVPIERAEATVVLPATARAFADSAPWQAHCYAGVASSGSDAGCTAEVVAPGSYRFTSGRLEPGEGLTLAAGWPKGVVPPPPVTARAWDWLLRWGPLVVPVLVFFGVFAYWRRHGRDPRAGSVVARWEPPDDLRPGPAGTLVDQRADMDDVVATILDLAVRGYVRIEETTPKIDLPGVTPDSLAGRLLSKIGIEKKDWEIVRLDGAASDLRPFERTVLDGVLKGHDRRRLSALHEEFYKTLPEVKKDLYAELVRQNLFSRDPSKTRAAWMVSGGALAALGGGGAIALAGSTGIWSLVPAAIGSGLVLLGFGWVMPSVTAKGAEKKREVDGLEEYIRRAEKAEIEFRDAPEKTPELFSRLLPYAVALDVSDLWVDKFQGVLASSPPTWYVGTAGGWSGSGFRSSLAGFQTAAASTLASSPGGSSGSGGGGSVGGGGGGGGGGSW